MERVIMTTNLLGAWKSIGIQGWAYLMLSFTAFCLFFLSSIFNFCVLEEKLKFEIWLEMKETCYGWKWCCWLRTWDIWRDYSNNTFPTLMFCQASVFGWIWKKKDQVWVWWLICNKYVCLHCWISHFVCKSEENEFNDFPHTIFIPM